MSNWAHVIFELGKIALKEMQKYNTTNKPYPDWIFSYGDSYLLEKQKLKEHEEKIRKYIQNNIPIPESVKINYRDLIIKLCYEENRQDLIEDILLDNQKKIGWKAEIST